MAGMTDAAFRSLCIEAGADLTFSEMVSAKGLEYGSERTERMLALAPNEERIAVQVFGHEPDTMARQAARIEEMLGDSLFAIDINMGCPARKIVRKGDGSALMRDPAHAARVVTAIRAAVSVPVSVKFRRGYRIGEDSCVGFALAMEEAGADAITLHPRFAMQYYKGDADWSCIARVKQAVGIPVVGNGDVRSGTEARALLDATGCDHIMIGRGALGSPWVFADAKRVLAGEGPLAPPSASERMGIACRHARILAAEPHPALLRMRKHAHYYVAGMPGASEARRALSSCSTLEEFEAVFQSLAGEG